MDDLGQQCYKSSHLFTGVSVLLVQSHCVLLPTPLSSRTTVALCSFITTMSGFRKTFDVSVSSFEYLCSYATTWQLGGICHVL